MRSERNASRELLDREMLITQTTFMRKWETLFTINYRPIQLNYNG